MGGAEGRCFIKIIRTGFSNTKISRMTKERTKVIVMAQTDRKKGISRYVILALLIFFLPLFSLGIIVT